MRRQIFSSALLLTALLFILSNKSASAQDTDNKLYSPHGIQFYFISEYAVAYKFSSSNNWNYRLQLDFGAVYSDQNSNDQTFSGENPSDQYESGDDKKNFNITFSPQLMYSIFKSEGINLYTGFGPVLNYSHLKYSYSQKNNDQNSSSENSYENKDNTFSAGLRGFIGVESFIRQSISVFAETQITGVKTWTSRENNSYSGGVENYKTTSDKNGWFVNITNIRIGASFYF